MTELVGWRWPANLKVPQSLFESSSESSKPQIAVKRQHNSAGAELSLFTHNLCKCNALWTFFKPLGIWKVFSDIQEGQRDVIMTGKLLEDDRDGLLFFFVDVCVYGFGGVIAN